MNTPTTTPTKLIESDYEVRLGVFEGPLDLLLYLVQKNELNPREISIAAITDQYLIYIDGLKDMNLSNAGEFLVMAARLMRLKARELLPADQKDELEDMEYELDRQALIQQMLEYQKFKEAARVLRNFEGKNFGAFGRGKDDTGEEKADAETEGEAGVYDLLAAFRSVVLSKPRIPVHEVEIDDVTIEDKMQEVEIALQERGRSLFEDLFSHDPRTIAQVVTFMSILELAKLDRIVFRQSHAMGPIWVYRKQGSAAFAMELENQEMHLDPIPEFKPGLVEIVQAQIKQRAVKNALEEALRELEQGLDPDAISTPSMAMAPEAIASTEGSEALDTGSPLEAESAVEYEAAMEAELTSAAGAENSSTEPEPNPAETDDDAMITEESDPVAHAALRDLVKRMREEVNPNPELGSNIPEDED